MGEGPSIGRLRRTIGRVKTIEPGLVTIVTPAGKLQRLTTNASTTAFEANEGTPADIHIDDRVVVRYHPGSKTDAQEVIVLAPDTVYGLPVTEAEDDWIAVRDFQGIVSSMLLTDAKIDKTTPVPVADVVNFSIVFVIATQGDNGDLTASEIIVLPESTTFGT
jgi:hypothetical protein